MPVRKTVVGFLPSWLTVLMHILLPLLSVNHWDVLVAEQHFLAHDTPSEWCKGFWTPIKNENVLFFARVLLVTYVTVINYVSSLLIMDALCLV